MLHYLRVSSCLSSTAQKRIVTGICDITEEEELTNHQHNRASGVVVHHYNSPSLLLLCNATLVNMAGDAN